MFSMAGIAGTVVQRGTLISPSMGVIAYVASVNATDGDVFDGTFSELARTGLDDDDAVSGH